MQRRKRIHGHFGRGAWLSLAVLGAGLSLRLGDAGATDPNVTGTLPVTGWDDRISPGPEDTRPRPSSGLIENLYYEKGAGFEYRWELNLGGHDFELRPMEIRF